MNAKELELKLIDALQREDVLKEKTAALEARCAALAAELSAVEVIHNEAVFITDEHYEKCPPEVQKMIRSLAVMQIPAYQAFLDEVRAKGVGTLSNAAQSVIAERQRQQSAEGWTPEHDDQCGESQLLWASSCYVLNTIHSFNRIPLDWPWEPEWWKPTNPRRDLVKAGALILAEIERIDRAAAGKGE